MVFLWHVMEPVYYPGVICSTYHSNGCGRKARIRKRGMPGERQCNRVLPGQEAVSSIFNLQGGDKVTVHRFQVRPELELDQIWYQQGDGNCKSLCQEFCLAVLFCAFLAECDNTAGKWTFWASNLAKWGVSHFLDHSSECWAGSWHWCCFTMFKPANRLMLLCCFWFNDVLKIIWSALLASWSFCLCRRINAICCMWW